jgi:C-terminal processing protease CtpA/Prc
MKKKLSLTLTIFVWSISIFAQATKHPASTPLPNTISVSDKVYFLSYFWSEAKYNFVFFDELDFCWDSLYKATIPEVIATENDFEYYRVLRRFAASLKDGHTQISDRGQFFKYQDYVPFSGRIINDDFFVTYVKIPYDKIIPPGSKIIEVNGMSFKDYLNEKIYPFINSNSPSRIKMHAEFNLLSADLITEPLQLRYITPKGEIKFHVFARNGEATRTPEDEYAGFRRRRPNQIMSLSWEKDSIAYLGINSFNLNAERMLRLDTLLDEASKATGLIIDLRYNGGGTTGVAYQLLRRISKQNYFLTYGYQTRINDGVKRANGNWVEDWRDFYLSKAYRTHLPDTIFIPDTVKKFNMPIIVLISEFTFSAAEDFLIMLYEMEDRPLLIGTPTGGSTGSPLVIADGMIGENFPGNGLARLCTRRVLFPYSLKPFNSSIMPDVLVEYDSIEEYLLGKDKVLNTALEMIKEMGGL